MARTFRNNQDKFNPRTSQRDFIIDVGPDGELIEFEAPPPEKRTFRKVKTTKSVRAFQEW